MFGLVRESEFGRVQLAMHPVWARYYEPLELEEVFAWGVDRAAFLLELERVSEGSDHAMYPVLRTDPLPVNLDLYIRAEFVTCDQRALAGYVCGVTAEIVVLFYDKEQFTFYSTGFSRWNLEAEARLQQAVKDPVAVVFPLSYRTAYQRSDGTPLAGVFLPLER